MERPASLNDRGMTLVELLISMLIMMVVALALVQSSIVAMNANVTNEMRNEAVSVAEQQMNTVRNTSFANLSTLPTTTTVSRNIRSLMNVQFTSTLAQSVVNANATQVTVTVSWTYRGAPKSYSMSTVMRNQ